MLQSLKLKCLEKENKKEVIKKKFLFFKKEKILHLINLNISNRITVKI